MRVEIQTMCADKYIIEVLQNKRTFVIAFLIANSIIELFLLFELFQFSFQLEVKFEGREDPALGFFFCSSASFKIKVTSIIAALCWLLGVAVFFQTWVFSVLVSALEPISIEC